MAPSTDPRFARLHTDPRFRRPKQKALKVELDERFKDVLESEEFGGKGKGKGKSKGDARVDKRGRPLASTHQADQLKRFYRLRSASPEGENGFVDYARGEGALPSSGSEDGSSEEDASSDEEQELELGGERKVMRFDPLALVDDQEESEDSEDEEEDEDDEDHLNVNLSEDEDEESRAGPSKPRRKAREPVDDEEEEEDYAEPTKRIAAVNLDWDNLRATDLYAVFNSFLQASKTDGKLLHVRIYPSEFGKERMEREEKEGPGGGIFAVKNGLNGSSRLNGVHDDDESDEEEDEEEEGFPSTMLDEIAEEDEEDAEEEAPKINGKSAVNGKTKANGPKEIDGLEIISDVSSDDGAEGDVNMDQLRQYQLERLRYFYAIATFSTVQAAQFIVSECNGTEFERTANVLDLTYVPDEMEFTEDDMQDEATKESKGYKGNDFVTDALRHSKVKLTWDQDDPNRIKVTRRNLTREQLEEEDLQAYIASSGSDKEDDEQNGNTGNGNEPSAGPSNGKQSRKEAMRGLLLNGDDEFGDVWGKAGRSNYKDLETDGRGAANGEMEITFQPGLSGVNGKGKNDEQLTTLEKYQMRVKEKKARKKEKVELRRAAKTGNGDKEQDGDDDFFGDDESVERDEPNDVLEDEMEEENLAVGGGRHVDHFSMKDILRAEKGEGKGKKRKRSKKKGKGGDEREIELGKEGWKIDTKDERFKALHEEPDFAIDPSNPRFTRTNAMKELLEDGRRARTNKQQKNTSETVSRNVGPPINGGADLSKLVASVKAKTAQAGPGRKRSRH